MDYYYWVNSFKASYTAVPPCGSSCANSTADCVTGEWCYTTTRIYTAGNCHNAGLERAIFDENHNIVKYAEYNGSAWVESDVLIKPSENFILATRDGVMHFASQCGGYEPIYNTSERLKTNP